MTMNGEPRVEIAPSEGLPLQTYYTGLWLAVAVIVMLFTGLTSALVVRKGISNDWRPVALPAVLYYSSLLLVSGSLWIEAARRRFRGRAAFSRCRIQLAPLVLLGAAFLGATIFAWRKLIEHGVTLGTSPGSSFLYLLTVAYAVLFLGALAAMGFIVLRAKHLRSVRQGRIFVNVAAIYWHFMAGLWIYVLVLISINV